MSNPADYICPICQLSLEQKDNRYCCANAHSFDIAKQSYVNLLTVQQKKTKNPGDNKIMINARRNFLDKQYYDCLIPACITLLQKHTEPNGKILDIGCGDGYFTAKIAELLAGGSQCYGLDISKEAIKVAAGRDKEIHWMVASSKEIPLPDNSLSAVIKINSPATFEQLATKLTSNGVVLSVTPGAAHLDGLKQQVYADAKPHNPEPSPNGFVSIDQILVESKLHLDNTGDIQNLFNMTPFAWNAPKAIREKIALLETLDTTIAFQLNIWQQQESQ